MLGDSFNEMLDPDMKTYFIGALLVITIFGCASSNSVQNSQNKGPLDDPREEFYVRWGSDKLTFMKAASAAEREYIGADPSGSELKYYNPDWRCNMIVRFYSGRYGSITYDYEHYGSGHPLRKQYDKLIQYATSIDAKNRLVFPTSSGAILVERGNGFLRFTNTSIAGSD